MSSPSIIPNDRLDRDFYIVLENFAGGAAFRETDEDYDYHTLITDLLLGQFGQVLRVVGFNPAEGWSRDTFEDIARELERNVSASGSGDFREIAGFHRGAARPQDRRAVAAADLKSRCRLGGTPADYQAWLINATDSAEIRYEELASDSPHKRLPDEIRWADPAPLAFSPPSAWPSPHVVATFRLPAKPAQSYCRSR